MELRAGVFCCSAVCEGLSTVSVKFPPWSVAGAEEFQAGRGPLAEGPGRFNFRQRPEAAKRGTSRRSSGFQNRAPRTAERLPADQLSKQSIQRLLVPGRQLQRRQPPEQIRKIEIPNVGQPEDLTLHRLPPVRDSRPQPVPRSVAIAHKSIPAGAFTAIKGRPGNSAANNSSPIAVTASRAALASNCAFATSLSIPTAGCSGAAASAPAPAMSPASSSVRASLPRPAPPTDSPATPFPKLLRSRRFCTASPTASHRAHALRQVHTPPNNHAVACRSSHF